MIYVVMVDLLLRLSSFISVFRAMWGSCLDSLPARDGFYYMDKHKKTNLHSQ